MLSKLQYISQGNTLQEQEQNIKQALDNGADWIQVRWKNSSEKEMKLLCEKVRKWCIEKKSVCIINDSISIAKEIDADGVHLGLHDDSISKAKEILGKGKIIGGTANTLEDVIQRTNEGCDYIGLGPFRFTTTKEKLSPILGIEGYKSIVHQLELKNIQTPPIYAIGGIDYSDIETIIEAGIYGVALSGVITKNPEIILQIKNLLQ